MEDFLSLADSRSFSHAARDRHVTQSAFSRPIQALESWLGVTLVNRSVYAARTLVFSSFPNWLKRLNRGFGAVTVRVLAVNVPEGVQQLVEGDCDLLIGYHHAQLPILLDPNRFPFLTLEQAVVRLDPELECEWEFQGMGAANSAAIGPCSGRRFT